MAVPTGGAAAAGRARRGVGTAWLLFAPPFAAVALRWWLNARSELDPTPWQALRAASELAATPGQLMWQASQPFLFTVGALALIALAARVLVRRFGWRRVQPFAAVLWIALWLAVAAAVGLQHLNRAASQALPAQIATVLQVRAQPPSERGPGGAEVLLLLPGFDAPQSVLLEQANASALPPGTRLQLALARGRFGDRYVTGWQVVQP